MRCRALSLFVFQVAFFHVLVDNRKYVFPNFGRTELGLLLPLFDLRLGNLVCAPVAAVVAVVEQYGLQIVNGVRKTRLGCLIVLKLVEKG